MAEANAAPATTTNEAAPAAQDTVLSGLPVVSENETVLDASDSEAKAQQEADNKRILEADEKTLSPEDATRKTEILKQKQEAIDKAAEEVRAKGVPEKYELKAPEGFTLTEADIAKHSAFFKEAGLSNKQAQMAVDYEAKVQKERMALVDEQFKTWNENNVKETMAHPGIKQELAYVAKVRGLLSQETLEALNASGIGNQKSFILDAAKIGRLFSEEHLVDDKATRKPSSSGYNRDEIAEKFYPGMANKQ